MWNSRRQSIWTFFPLLLLRILAEHVLQMHWQIQWFVLVPFVIVESYFYIKHVKDCLASIKEVTTACIFSQMPLCTLTLNSNLNIKFNLKLFSIGVKQLFELIFLGRKADRLFLFWTAFSWDTDLIFK